MCVTRGPDNYSEYLAQSPTLFCCPFLSSVGDPLVMKENKHDYFSSWMCQINFYQLSVKLLPKSTLGYTEITSLWAPC